MSQYVLLEDFYSPNNSNKRLDLEVKKWKRIEFRNLLLPACFSSTL